MKKLELFLVLLKATLLCPTLTYAQSLDSNFIRFSHFIADNSTMRCWADEHVTPFNQQVRGACLGGWLVLEPWITPSLFYQFLGKHENNTAVDMYSFCNVLGPEEGNKQLRRHWDAWVTEDHIRELVEEGSVNSLRLPVGDWMYKPYGPFVGCTDGALDYVEKVLDWANNYGVSVLIDIHGVKGSQNGFDNSGNGMGFEWTSVLNTEPKGLVTFEHWPIRTAEWMGEFDRNTAKYVSYNHENVAHTLDVIKVIVEKYKDHPAVLGLEPVNEPWQYTPIDRLKRFYWEGYLIVKGSAPGWKYIMHDSFRLDPNLWGGFMAGCPDRALDTHIYQAWNFPASRADFYVDACNRKKDIAAVEIAFGPVIVGEWSLATDNCAMWLNGFNDNLSGYPMLPCKYIPCPDPYMGFDQPGTPVDPGKPILGPFGTGMSGPSWGMCPVDRDWVKEGIAGDSFMHAPPKAPDGLDDTDNVMTNLAEKKINAFSITGHGFYFWNFRTEIYEPQWNYLEAVRRGWITTDDLDSIASACMKEDNGKYKCVAKRGMLDSSLLNGIDYILKAEDLDPSIVANLTGDALAEQADILFDNYWRKYFLQGSTCDFGGVAQLEELNYTYTPPPPPPGPSTGQRIVQPLTAALIGVGFIGFMFLFAAALFQLGGRAREKDLAEMGAFRKSFGGFNAFHESVSDLVSSAKKAKTERSGLLS